VWPSDRRNLIKVVPYDFFTIGDINAPFSPKKQDILPAPVPEQAPNGAVVQPAAPITQITSGMEDLPGASGAVGMELERKQIEEQEKLVEKQIMDRPLLHLQEELDKEEDERQKSEGDVTPLHNRVSIFRGGDEELFHLQKHLTALHSTFYSIYDERQAENDDGFPTIPDVGDVLDRMKANVLRGTVIVLSGLVPLGVDVALSEIGSQTLTFGATVHTKISKRVTHLVISTARPRTQKVTQAAKIPHIKIVNQNWLADCISQWRLLDETPYLVEVDPADRIPKLQIPNPETISDSGLDATNNRPQLTIIDEAGEERVLEDDEDDSDDEEEDPADDDDKDEPARDGDTSPVQNLDWDDVDQELLEFLESDDDSTIDGQEDVGSTAGNSEAESMRPSPSPSKKRKPVDDDLASDEEGLAASNKKQKLATKPGSKLRNVQTLNGTGDEEEGEPSSSLPTPGITGDEEDVVLVPNGAEAVTAAGNTEARSGTDGTDGGGNWEEGRTEDDDDLEAELMAELDAEENG
jgi:RNA polymerase II subunit A C-terminal domain phosphatase